MSERQVCIEPILLDDVLRLDTRRFNSNNHWENGPPEDYERRLAQGNTSKWINAFHEKYETINIDPTHIKVLREAAQIGIITGRSPKLYKEDIEEIAQVYNKIHPLFFEKHPNQFVRTENVSLKYGQHGIGPYNDFRSIFESLVSSRHGHSPVNANTVSIKLYFFPWKVIDSNKEFRLFVFENEIKAISQQNSYCENTLLASEGLNKDLTIQKWVEVILAYHEKVIKKNITHISNYTIDIALLQDSEPYFIEINGFGKEYAAGSGLFHWILDEHILCNPKPGPVYFRYVTLDKQISTCLEPFLD